ncbi:hypothetical protein EON66_02645 [archaeon]|nr:MAG: hypothetical protein EON66_02645 [archaeon]
MAAATAPPTPLDAALLAAADAGDASQVRRLLAEGANVNASGGSNDATTPLHQAAKQGHLNVAELLLKAGARTDAGDASRLDALHCAIANGHATLAHCIWQYSRDARFSAVHVAALGQGYDHLAIALPPAAVDAVDGCGFAPLRVAVLVGNAAMVERLLGAGADKEATDSSNGYKLLHWACHKGHEACVRALVAAGANVEAADKYGATPLHIACSKGHEACVGALVAAGANVEAKEKRVGVTPLFVSCDYGHEACVRALLAAGANVEAVNNDGWTPLHTACKNGHEACVHALLDAGAKVNAASYWGWTPLILASQMGHGACVGALLAAGANKEASNKDDWTALHIACQKGHDACVHACARCWTQEQARIQPTRID